MLLLRLFYKSFFKKEAFPEYITLFITNRCNAGCPHCFYHNSLNKPMDELKIEEIKRLASSMPPFAYLTITGGEPFLRGDIAEIVTAFAQNPKPALIIIPTNGSLTESIIRQTEAMLLSCPKQKIEIALSIDAYGDEHDILKQSPRLFKKVEESFKGLSELRSRYKNLKLSIGMVFQRENQSRLEDAFNRLLEWKPDMIYLNLVRGDIKDPSLQGVDLDLYASLSEAIQKRFQPRSPLALLVTAVGIMKRSLILKTLIEDRFQTPCYAGLINTVIYPDGNVGLCEILDKKIGNLRGFDMDLGKLWASDTRRDLVRWVKESNCYCTHECNLTSNILFNPLNWLRLCTILLKKAIKG
jgi:MoaA/NifB/PqqE/SkfB family radical SAM enzyme